MRKWCMLLAWCCAVGCCATAAGLFDWRLAPAIVGLALYREVSKSKGE